MKIAILTLPLHTNYGGILQAYALQTVLEHMGHTVEVLQKKSIETHPLWLMPLVYLKRSIFKILKNRKIEIFYELKQAQRKKEIEQNVSKFISKNIKQRYIDKFSEIKPTDYDAFVVGSDQVWRKQYFSSLWQDSVKEAYLNFTQGWDIIRISYAASFGLDNILEYSEKEIEECRKDLQYFTGVSVRELSGIDICRKEFGTDAIQLPDPTLLLSQKDYQQLISNYNSSLPENSLLCYILDPTDFAQQIITLIADKHNLIPTKVNVEVDNWAFPISKRIAPPVEKWLRDFMDARLIVTDSFHACVFSILFNKPFIVIENPQRGITRIQSLLKTFGLEKRLIPPTSNINSVLSIIQSEYKFDNNDLLKRSRAAAMRFLYAKLITDH